MDPITVAITAGVTVALAGGGAYLTYRQRREREALWRRLADDRGGTYVQASGWLTRREASIEVRAHQTICALDTVAVGSGNHRRLHTRCRGYYSLGRGPSFRVKRAGLTGRIGRRFGLTDVPLDDPEFDDEFLVNAKDAEATRAAWTADARRALRAHFPDADVSADGRLVKVVVPRLLDSEEALEAVLDLVGELTGFGGRLLERYRDLPGAIFEDVEGTFSESIAPGLWIDSERVRVRVEATLGPGAPGLRLVTDRPKGGEPYLLDLAGGTKTGALRGALDERAAALAGQLGPATVRAEDDTLTLEWEAPPEPAAVQRGVALLGRLAQAPPKLGAFR